ncbi:hypothetical protein PB2503_04927 [Parvularcula bermudensis HTCC2503]|uniref:Uncharacterized protein n=1 Tax=Parvularcula bermudensis (strain ATCC BAA-594 / HTCC2503 / KCTC 12087) TaxID=314260 RepID=E0TFP5_PARBH|nr:hypothetical protein [Parvularcula bermudensis]ADM09060.1 hypothetical protein PB2503_04927 [Parvularcula bermudensis HTCC2503]
MFIFRILLFIVAYVVVLAEVAVGSAATTLTDGAVWIVPGALVLALLLAISTFLLANLDLPTESRHYPNAIEWAVLVASGFFIAGTAFYFPNYIAVWLGASVGG